MAKNKDGNEIGVHIEIDDLLKQEAKLRQAKKAKVEKSSAKPAKKSKAKKDE